MELEQIACCIITLRNVKLLLHDGENAASNRQRRGKLVEDKVPAQVMEGKKKKQYRPEASLKIAESSF